VTIFTPFNSGAGVGPAGATWSNLPTALIPGAVVAQWDFDGDLTDSIGALTLTDVNDVLDGPLFNIIQGLQMVRIGNEVGGSPQYLERGVHDPVLELRGAMSVWAIVFYPNIPSDSSGSLIAAFRRLTAAPFIEANNRLWEVGVAQPSGLVFYNWQTGAAGTNVFGSFPNCIVPGEITLFSWSRAATADCTMFINGIQYGPTTPAPATLPTGGTSALVQLRVGSDASPDFGRNDMFMGGLAIADAAHTLAQHDAVLAAIRT